jgi:hypothetical protein
MTTKYQQVRTIIAKMKKALRRKRAPDAIDDEGFSLVGGLAQLEVLNQVEVPLYLYRVLKLNPDGDPMDHGVVAAANREQARELLKERFQRFRFPKGLVVRLYKLDRGDVSLPHFLDTEGIASEVTV